MKRKDLKVSGFYKMKDGFYRRITGMFLSTRDERRFKTTTDPDSDYVELEYVHCYFDGQAIPKQKPKYCSSKNFARLAQEETGIYKGDEYR